MMRRTLFALLALAACAAQEDTPPSGANHLAGTHWQRVDDSNAAPHFPTMDFSEDGAAGFAGCNRFFARVEQNGEALRFSNVGTTRMACQAESAQAAERNFLSALERTRYGHYDRDALVLLDENQAQLARFERAD